MNFKGSGWSRSTHSLEGGITKAAIHPHVDLSDCWSPIVPILVDSEPRVKPVIGLQKIGFLVFKSRIGTPGVGGSS